MIDCRVWVVDRVLVAEAYLMDATARRSAHRVRSARLVVLPVGVFPVVVGLGRVGSPMVLGDRGTAMEGVVPAG
ncbi:hypothetical protein GCM10012279_02670 [Micromonospora yangpuensis]|nr:hypothetical protein GCM10012279_02670 [Micromonospora yangpuensis]